MCGPHYTPGQSALSPACDTFLTSELVTVILYSSTLLSYLNVKCLCKKWRLEMDITQGTCPGAQQSCL